MPGDRLKDRQWVRYSSLGIELAAVIVGFTLLGLWLDRHFGSAPWGVLTCLGLGLVGGMYNFVRGAFRATRDDSKKSSES